MKFVALILACVTAMCMFAACTGEPNPTAPTTKPSTPSTPKEDEIPEVPETVYFDMYYDDRISVSEIVSGLTDTIQIKDQVVTSKVLGSDTPDENVLIYDQDGYRLIAVGTGTAVVVIDGVEYNVRVSAAPITLVMITGHSLGAGSKGDANQSIVCEAGTAYNTTLTIDSASWLSNMIGSSLGYTEADRMTNIDALTKDATGTKGARGINSALAYEWHNLTGEKMWVINCAVGGSCINQWQPEASDKFHERTVSAMNRASEVLKNEVEAGHFEYRTTIILNFSSANFSHQNVSYNDTLLRMWHDNMWKGFKNGSTVDINGDGKNDGPTAMGYVPIWTPTMNDYNRDYYIVYNRSASSGYSHIFLASDLTRFWKTDEGIANNFPVYEYRTQNGNKISVPTKTTELFPDGTHLCQAGYNVQGIHIANTLYSYLIEAAELKSLTLLNITDNLKGEAVGDSLQISVGKQYNFIIHTDPVGVSDLDITVDGVLALDKPFYVSASSAGTGTITIKRGDTVIKTVTVTAK